MQKLRHKLDMGFGNVEEIINCTMPSKKLKIENQVAYRSLPP